MKITLIGDIMCEPPVLEAAARSDGTYCFNDAFEKVHPMFQESDYVIGNMEFPLAGAEAEYTNNFFVFNAPDSYAEAIKNAGIDLVSTVNNHTLDRGAEGIIRTMQVLDKLSLPYVGTSFPENGREGAYFFTLDGVRFAVVAYSYGINKKLAEDHALAQSINRLAAFGNRVCGIQIHPKNWVDVLLGFLPFKKRKNIKRRLGHPYLPIQIDNLINNELVDGHMEQFAADIKKAKEQADFAICFPHTGGQFNAEVGDFSKYVFEKALAAGADAVLASHSHIVQKAAYIDGKPCAYSLGNFNMVPDSPVTTGKLLPDFGLAMHLYMDGKQVEKVTFSILKAVCSPGKQIVTWPVDELYKELTTKKEQDLLEKQVRTVYRIVTEKELPDNAFLKEYILT